MKQSPSGLSKEIFSRFFTNFLEGIYAQVFFTEDSAHNGNIFGNIIFQRGLFTGNSFEFLSNFIHPPPKRKT